jgi:hypothetical protein
VEHQQEERTEDPQIAAPLLDALPAPALGDALSSRSLLSLQRSAGNAAVGALVLHAEADDSIQRALARAAGHRANTEPAAPPAFRSPSLLLRSKLRTAVLQRAVTTSGGEWDTDNYDIVKDDDGTGARPAAENWRGADIKVRFKPNTSVDAEQIGLTQSVQSLVGGTTNLTPGAAARAIPAADAKSLNTGPGETDVGTAIDQSTTNTSPMYAVENASSTSLTDAADARFGEHGHHYTDPTKGAQDKSAWIGDRPRRANAEKDSRQIFEVAALATKGAQAGTYYGSVRWGWRTDSAGAFTKVDLATVSEGVPSSTFLKAGAIWNASKTPGGNKDTVNLPLPDVHVTTGPVTLKPPIPMVDIALPVGTRMQIITPALGPSGDGTVKIVDGPHTGITGDVSATEWINIQDERT